MRRPNLSLFLTCQLLILNMSFVHGSAEAIECDYTVPVTRLGRSVRFDQPIMTEEYRREVIDRLISYFRWPSRSLAEVNSPSISAQSVGEVYVVGQDIYTYGITEVDGAVPISGSVTFGGDVQASGSVTISGRCAPASGVSTPLLIGKPLLPLSKPLVPSPPPLPVKVPIAEVSPVPEYIPAPVQEILTITETVPMPTIILPPVVIPAVVIPAYVLPEVVIPTLETYNPATGSGIVVVNGNAIDVNGATYIDGRVPLLGEVAFSGYVPARGTVTICTLI